MKKQIGMTLLAGAVATGVIGVQPAHAATNVVINEVMWNPSTGGEWIELHNPTGAAIDVSGLLVSDNEGNDVAEGEYWIPAGTVIPAGGYLTIGASTTSATLKWASTGPALSNSGDGIHLVRDTNKDGVWASADKIDGVEFTSSWGGNGNGSSLERRSADSTSTSASSWGSSTVSGGTMGAVNSIATDGGGTTPPPDGGGTTPPSGKTVLFDNAHGETAGNADWTIAGAYSDYAQALRNAGYNVIQNTGTISSTTLANVDVLVLPEPNINFTNTEKTAINDFVLNKGKGLYIIADHIVSDRNNDGWDSVEIFNGYTQGNYSSTSEWIGKSFGFRATEDNVVQEPITDIRPHPITNGVSQIAAWNGCTFTITNSTYAKGVAYLTGVSTPYAVVSQLPSGGRVAGFGDSSPFNDGTGTTSVLNYNSFPQYNHAQIAVNTIKWLAKDVN